MVTHYELYSDEREDHFPSNYLFLGGIVVTETGANRIRTALHKVREVHSLSEMK
jgi:hypothetical protein